MHPNVPTPRRAPRRAIALVAVAAVLAACGSSTASSSNPSTGAGAITARDPWIKSASGGMTAAFVTLANSGSTDDVLVSASTPAAGMVQLHETVMKDGAMVMQERKQGIVVPAQGKAVLEPGGEHIMLMELTGPIRAGDTVAITLSFESGATLLVRAAARDYDGGKESYVPSPSATMSRTS